LGPSSQVTRSPYIIRAEKSTIPLKKYMPDTENGELKGFKDFQIARQMARTPRIRQLAYALRSTFKISPIK
jgi:hypothetical protein